MDMQRDRERILDEYLVMSSQAGSKPAFEELARRWTPRLVRYAARALGSRRVSAESVRDVVQETWLGAIRGLRRLDDPARFPAWIYSIATRKCADWVRAAVRRRRFDASLERIAGLPDGERSVVYLYYGGDLGVTEVAAVLGVPAGTVKSRLHHARQALRRSLESFPAASRLRRTP
jgi:DNA-directed RNA polymerase specialized sigma24 family protein